ncbi:MAG: hypothetical protein ACRD13_05555, partial [Terriglobales bacterium]
MRQRRPHQQALPWSGRAHAFAGPAWAWYLGLGLVLAAGLLMPLHVHRHRLHLVRLLSLAPRTAAIPLPVQAAAGPPASAAPRKLRGAG